MPVRPTGDAMHPRSGVRRRRAIAGLLSIAVIISAVSTVLGLSSGVAAAAPTTSWIWSDTTKPATVPAVDTSAVELGVRFTATVNGSADGIRYYKLSGSSPAKQATLWGPAGQVLARGAFPSTTTSAVGWQVATLDKAVSLSANSTYVASYLAPQGRYPADQNTLGGGRQVGSAGLVAKAGVYSYGSQSAYPTKTWKDSNYFVDVRFSTGASSSPATSVAPTTQPPATTSSSTTVRSTTTAPSTTTVRSTTTAPPTTTVRSTTTPSSTASTTSSAASGTGKCVGAANTPGGPDPWGGCWPGPQNTGYPKGLPGDTRTPVTLTAYTGPTTIRSCGVVIDSKIVNETILVQAGNGTHSGSTPCVTIKNSLVKGVIFAEQVNQGPVLITDTEVVPPDLPWWENIGRSNIFVYRVNSHGGQGVIKCDSYCEAKDNWVHGMNLGMEYHYNAFGGNGTNQFVIEHNWASCGDWDIVSSPGSDAGCSADIGFYGDYAPIQNIKINRNFLAGMRVDSSVPNAPYRQPGYCLNPGYYPGKPFPAPLNVSVTDNIFGRGSSGKCGAYGPTNSLNSKSNTNGNVWTNNRFEDGVAIARIEE